MQRAVVTEQKMRNLNVRQENAMFNLATVQSVVLAVPSSEMPEETNIAYVTVVLVTLLTSSFSIGYHAALLALLYIQQC